MRITGTLTLIALLFTGALAEVDLDAIGELWSTGARDSVFATLAVESRLALASGDSTRLARLLLLEGSYRAAIGDHRRGELVLKEVENLTIAIPDSVTLMSAVRWMSVVVGSQGRSVEAFELYQRLENLALALGDPRHEAWAHVGMAWDAWKRGDTVSSAFHYSRAADRFTGTDDVEGELWALNGLATVQTNQGNYEAALSSYQTSLARAREAGLPMAEAIALNGLGSLEYPLGLADRALLHFRDAAAIHEKHGYRREKIPALLNISMCLNSLGRTREARETLESALVTCREGGYADLEATVLVKMAESWAMAGRHGEAIESYREALLHGDRLRHALRINAYIGLSESLKHQGHYQEALLELDEASSLLKEAQLNWHKLRIIGKRGLLRVRLEEHRQALELFLDLAEQSQHAGIVEFRFHALSEAAGCLEAMAMPDSALHLYFEAARYWESERKLLLDPDWRERRGSRGRQIFTDLATLMIERGDLEEAFERLQYYKGRTLLERMLGPGKRYENRLDSSSAATVGLDEFRSTVLREDELFLDFYLGPEHLVIFAVDGLDLRVRLIPAGAELESRFRAYRDLIASVDRVDRRSLDLAGSHLFEELFGESGDFLGKHSKILVSPDGVLNLLPFQELPGGNHRAWIRVPSASILARIRSAGSENRDVARILAMSSALGPNSEKLAGAVNEVETLHRHFDHVTRWRMDEPGSDPGGVDLAGFNILHIAAHAKNDDQSPWQSMISFRPDSGIRAAEIADLKLDADLAVLSSCTSAGSAVLSGEGVLGLSSAFLSAGVPCVLATLWPVDDIATARFVELYYKALASGASCSDALQDAQAGMRTMEDTRHPFYWAGFVVIGEGGLRVELVPRPSWPVAFLSLGLVLLLLLVGGVRHLRFRYS